MQIIENEVVSQKTIVIDEKHFINCVYEQCLLVYSGAEYALANTAFKNCSLNLTGAAQRTAAFLGGFGMLPPPAGMIPVASPKQPGGKVQ